MTLMPGDGIGPEMMGHVKDIFRVAGVPIDFETVKLDSTTDNYDDLHNAIQSVKRNGCALKGNVEAKINRPDIKVCGGLFENRVLGCANTPKEARRSNEVDSDS